MEEPAPRAASDERPQLVEEKPMPTPVPEAAAPPRPSDGPGRSRRDAGSRRRAGAIPVRSAAPEYPPAAMRNGDQGTVLVRVEVGADGVPTSVEVAQRSGSRDLDRAAVNAVRQWRFQPAQRDGQAVAVW